MADRYVFSTNNTPGAAANIGLELAAVSGHPFELVMLEISQESSTTSAGLALQLGISTAAATVWTTGTVTGRDLDDTGKTANTTAKGYSSGTSTDGTSTVVRTRIGLNNLSLTPVIWTPPAEARILVGSGHFLAIKWATAPAASTLYNITAYILER